MDISNILSRYNWKTILAIAVLAFLILYPYPIILSGALIVAPFLKQRFFAVAILFLVLRGFIHDYYAPIFSMVFLAVVILTPFFTFGQIVITTLLIFLGLKLLKKI